MAWTRRDRIFEANIGPKRFTHLRTVSWQMSTPRSKARSSTLRSDSGKRTYSITTIWITSGEESNQRNGLSDLVMPTVSGASVTGR